MCGCFKRSTTKQNITAASCLDNTSVRDRRTHGRLSARWWGMQDEGNDEMFVGYTVIVFNLPNNHCAVGDFRLLFYQWENRIREVQPLVQTIASACWSRDLHSVLSPQSVLFPFRVVGGTAGGLAIIISSHVWGGWLDLLKLRCFCCKNINGVFIPRLLETEQEEPEKEPSLMWFRFSPWQQQRGQSVDFGVREHGFKLNGLTLGKLLNLWIQFPFGEIAPIIVVL